MFYKFVLLIVSTLAILVAVTSANADQAAEAKSMVEKAVAMVKEKGLDSTLKAINDLKGPFVKGDLYVFAMSLDNINLATGSPNNKPILGKMLKGAFAEKMLKIVKTKGSGWVEYTWAKPGEKDLSAKRSFFMRVPGENAYFGCGYYLK